MKRIIAFIMLSISLFHNSYAIDQDGIDILVRQGMQVKMGELTGAGSKFSINNLAALVLPETILLKEDCSAIILKSSPNPKVSDIIKIKVQGHEINASEFIGFAVH